MPVKRDMARLREINGQLERRLNLNYPGLGGVFVIFDSNRPGADPERPVSIMLHGVQETEAVRLLRKVLDLVDRSQVDVEKVLEGPIIVKPN